METQTIRRNEKMKWKPCLKCKGRIYLHRKRTHICEGEKQNETKNECNKERTKDNPYEIWVSLDGSWTWRVLKKWQVDDNKPYARWFCAVKSPYTFGGFDIGDVYVSEIKKHARKMTDTEMKEELK